MTTARLFNEWAFTSLLTFVESIDMQEFVVLSLSGDAFKLLCGDVTLEGFDENYSVVTGSSHCSYR